MTKAPRLKEDTSVLVVVKGLINEYLESIYGK